MSPARKSLGPRLPMTHGKVPFFVHVNSDMRAYTFLDAIPTQFLCSIHFSKMKSFSDIFLCFSVVVSVRGTLSFNDLITYLSADSATYSTAGEGRCHRGILESARHLVSKLLLMLDTLDVDKREYTLLLTGHSLGAAIPSFVQQKTAILCHVSPCSFLVHNSFG